MELNDTQLSSAKPEDSTYELADGGGLTLLVQPNGAMWWQFHYRIDSHEKMLSLGVYPDVFLRKAHKCRDAARALVADGIDPSVMWKSDKTFVANTFEVGARE